MLKRVDESRHSCQTLTVVWNQYPMLLLNHDATLPLQVWYQNDLQLSSTQTFTNIFNLCFDLNLSAVTQFLHRTLQLMMLYYKTKFGCKQTSSLEDSHILII